jgi:hypothetical protein
MSQKSQSTQKSESKKPPKPAVEPLSPIEETAPVPELTQTGQFVQPGELPPDLARKQVQDAQQVAGNLFVQRELLKGVIQRQTPGEGGDTTPIPALGTTEEKRHFALHILKEAYGELIKKESKVVAKGSEKELRDAYDQSMINLGKDFKKPDGEFRKWEMGDSKKHPTMSKELVGFWDQDTGDVLIDTSKKPDQQVATLVHEMLHANAAGDFASTMGKTIDEGMTEKLTQQAFAEAGYSAPGGFYAAEIGLVNRLAGMFGENLMLLSYFNGTAILRSMVSTVLDDEEIFDKLVRAIKGNQTRYIESFFYLYERAAAGAELDKKIAAISSRLDWWVSDGDITAVENIWQGSTEDERSQLRSVIRNRVASLSDHGHRARLRILIGS